jgi:hypothetical protein
MASIIRYIEGRLYLKVNREKSKVSYITGVKFLGYSFYKLKGEGRLRIHPRSVEKMRVRIRELSSRSNGWGDSIRKEELRQYITGWINYYRLADMEKLMKKTDEWYRRRLRMVIWKQWKRVGTRMKNLMKLGVSRSKAKEWACSRKGYWHLANSWILATTITNERLKTAGYTFLSDCYLIARKLT